MFASAKGFRTTTTSNLMPDVPSPMSSDVSSATGPCQAHAFPTQLGSGTSFVGESHTPSIMGQPLHSPPSTPPHIASLALYEACNSVATLAFSAS